MTTAQPTPDDLRVEKTIKHFNEIYLRGIPPLITNESAFLSFICVLTAIEALAGFRYAEDVDKPKEGVRFTRFFATYFPQTYAPYVEKIWRFRCRMVHSFSPAGFSLTHYHRDDHLKVGHNGNPLLNAENFYDELVSAAQTYFAELRANPNLRALLIARLNDDRGGSINVGPIPLPGLRMNGATT